MSFADDLSSFVVDPDLELDYMGSEIPDGRDRSTRERVDRTDFSNGQVTVSLGTSAFARATILQTDGKLVVVGRVATGWGGGGYHDIGLVRLMPDGTLDTSFGTIGKVVTTWGHYDDWPHGVALDALGRIAVAARASNGSNLDFALLRYSTNGTLDTSFSSSGSVMTTIGTDVDIPRAIQVDTSGRLVLAGFRFDGTKHDSVVARYQSNGSLDTSFATTGKSIFTVGTSGSSITALTLNTNGEPMVAGGRLVGSVWSSFLARLRSDGIVDTSFNTVGNVIVTFNTGSSVAYGVGFQSSGKIMAGGNYTTTSGFTQIMLMRFTTNGRLDTFFRGQGATTLTVGRTSRITSLIASSDQKTTLSGTMTTAANSYTGDFLVARFLSNGQSDNLFGTQGVFVTPLGPGNDEAFAAVRNGKGETFVVGATQNGITGDIAIARVGNSGQLAGPGYFDYGFATDGAVYLPNSGYAIPDGTGRILLSGSSSFFIWRYLSSGAPDTSFNTTGAFYSALYQRTTHLIPVANGTTYVLGDNYTGVGAFMRLNSNGRLDTSFRTTGTTVLTVALGSATLMNGNLQTDGKLLVNGLRSYTNSFLYRLLSDGSWDTSFATVGYVDDTLGTNNVLRDSQLDTLGRLVGAGYAFGNGTSGSNYYVVRYATNGALDTSFGTTGYRLFKLDPFANTAGRVFFDTVGRLMITGYSTDSDDARQIYLMRLHTNGEADTSFGISGVFRADHWTFSSSFEQGSYAAAKGEKYFLATPLMTLLRITSNGFLDTGFGSQGSQGASLYNGYPLYLDSEGRPVSLYGGSTLSRGLP